ncbi:MAG: hypothetical protein JWL91_1723, partial [Sphingomonas bacterium]|nr:hypothetical protein [Sphingomonas bacterium]
WSSPVARQAHNLKVTGSNPVPATNINPVRQQLGGALPRPTHTATPPARHSTATRKRCRLLHSRRNSLRLQAQRRPAAGGRATGLERVSLDGLRRAPSARQRDGLGYLAPVLSSCGWEELIPGAVGSSHGQAVEPQDTFEAGEWHHGPLSLVARRHLAVGGAISRTR